MKNLFFIRSTTGRHSWEYYELKTEVLMFGDIKGYKYFVDCLNAARFSLSNVYLDEIDTTSNSMRVVVLPSIEVAAGEARLRIIERPVFVNESANMELVICGNSSGYKHLAALVNQIASDTDEDLDNHLHLDDDTDACLIRRSVSLNIRSPLIEWSKKKLEHWVDTVLERRSDYLPEDINYLFESPEPYQEIGIELARKYIQQ
jgi:hypothetical protein